MPADNIFVRLALRSPPYTFAKLGAMVQNENNGEKKITLCQCVLTSSDVEKREVRTIAVQKDNTVP